MNATTPETFEPDPLPVCEACRRFAVPDVTTRDTPDELFSECGCDEGPLVGGVRVEFGTLELPAPEPLAVAPPAPTGDQWEVDFYDPSRRGVWTRKFSDLEKATQFASGQRCWGKPATVKPIAPARTVTSFELITRGIKVDKLVTSIERYCARPDVNIDTYAEAERVVRMLHEWRNAVEWLARAEEADGVNWPVKKDHKETIAATIAVFESRIDVARQEGAA
jgi:hypothetical protein